MSAAPKLEYKAYCDSEKCAFEQLAVAPRRHNGKEYKRTELVYTGVKVKAVSRGAIFCPDCSSALFWSLTPPVERKKKK